MGVCVFLMTYRVTAGLPTLETRCEEDEVIEGIPMEVSLGDGRRKHKEHCRSQIEKATGL